MVLAVGPHAHVPILSARRSVLNHRPESDYRKRCAGLETANSRLNGRAAKRRVAAIAAA